MNTKHILTNSIYSKEGS